MDFFTSFRSKKTSEAGVWIQDDDVENCGCCGLRFALLIRKHHCRVSLYNLGRPYSAAIPALLPTAPAAQLDVFST